jgi:hypothetical protein
MDAFPEAILVIAAIFLGSIPAVALLIRSRSIRSRKRARLELKRHVQKIEVPGSTWS